jgi:hypothetical protein
MEQTYQNWEWIIGDHSDNPKETFAMLPKDERVIYHYENDIKGPDPRKAIEMGNKIYHLAHGEIFMFCADDDRMAPEALGLLVQPLLETREAPGWAYGKCVFVNPDESPTGTVMGVEQNFEQLVKHNNIPALSVAWNRKMVEKIGMTDESLPFAGDYEYWLRMMRVAKPAFIDRVLSYHTVHAGRTTSRYSGEQMAETAQIQARYRMFVKEKTECTNQ